MKRQLPSIVLLLAMSFLLPRASHSADPARSRPAEVCRFFAAAWSVNSAPEVRLRENKQHRRDLSHCSITAPCKTRRCTMAERTSPTYSHPPSRPSLPLAGAAPKGRSGTPSGYVTFVDLEGNRLLRWDPTGAGNRSAGECRRGQRLHPRPPGPSHHVRRRRSPAHYPHGGRWHGHGHRRALARRTLQ